MNVVLAARQTIVDALNVCVDLFRIMVPIVIVVKILTEFGLIKYLAVPLTPIMKLVGLPPQAGLIWATAMANNLYAGIWVYLALLPDMPALTVAQATTMAALMLVAHNLPVEGRITQKCGTSFWGQIASRFFGAFAFGLILHLFFVWTGFLNQPGTILWKTPPPDTALLGWIWGQVGNLTSLVVIITALMTVMRVLNYLKINLILNRMLQPLLRVMGIGRQAATITIIGLVVGIAYGGGLIIHEARTGGLSRVDIFSSITLMGLCHSLIEDSLLMILIGADFYTIIFGRLLFALIVVAVLSRWYARRHGHAPGVSADPIRR